MCVHPPPRIFTGGSNTDDASFATTSTRYRSPSVEVNKIVLKFSVAIALGVNPNVAPDVTASENRPEAPSIAEYVSPPSDNTDTSDGQMTPTMISASPTYLW